MSCEWNVISQKATLATFCSPDDKKDSEQQAAATSNKIPMAHGK
jgi:hypothetical protein